MVDGIECVKGDVGVPAQCCCNPRGVLVLAPITRAWQRRSPKVSCQRSPAVNGFFRPSLVNR